jgi:SAM-dependent methyltransferase
MRYLVRKLRQMVWWLRWKGANRFGGTKKCYICESTFRRFYPFKNGWQSYSTFIRKVQLVGSDVENFGCPFCLSNDRERHLFLYFDRSNLWKEIHGSSVLHFAPEKNLSKRIESCKPARYIKGDLLPENLFKNKNDVQRVDVTDIAFDSDTFDLVICNHVLEHVPDDAKAMREIHRVLRVGGKAVLQTPYSGLLHKTFQDPGITGESLRTEVYGQDDHVRLYGKDFFQRLEAAGFLLCVKQHNELSSPEEASKYGMNASEPFILVKKVQ